MRRLTFGQSFVAGVAAAVLTGASLSTFSVTADYALFWALMAFILVPPIVGQRNEVG